MNNSRAGFLLLEALVAIMIAAIALGVLARAIAGAWQDNRRPMERISALNVARQVASRLMLQSTAIAGHGRTGAFSYDTIVASIVIEPLDSLLAPLPPGVAAQVRQTKSSAIAELQRLSIDVRSTSGRRLTFETIRLDRSK